MADDLRKGFGDRFARLYYGLLAVRPEALSQLYHEDCHLSQSWSGDPDECEYHGVDQVMDGIHYTIGSQGEGSGTFVHVLLDDVFVDALQDASSVLVQMTGEIVFPRGDKNRYRFSQTAVLEPCTDGQPFLQLRNDIVHYTTLPLFPDKVVEPSPSLPTVEASPQPVQQTPRTPPTAPPANAPEVPAESLPHTHGPAPVDPPVVQEAEVPADHGAQAQRSYQGAVSWATIAASKGTPGSAEHHQAAPSAPPQGPPHAKRAQAPGAPGPANPSTAQASLIHRSGAVAPAPEQSSDRPVKLWVSGIPTEEHRTNHSQRFVPVKGNEVRDALNACLREHVPNAVGEVTEVDRKDDRKPFAFAHLRDEKTAKELVLLSKQRKVMLRGERLVLDLSNYNQAPVENLYTGAAPPHRGGWGYEERGRGKGKRDDGQNWAAPADRWAREKGGKPGRGKG